MDDLIAFLRARLDEREAKARAAGEIGTPDWHVGDEDPDTPESPAILDGNGEIVVYDEGRPHLAEAVHIADNDPAWVLADVEAKQQVIRLYETALFTQGLHPGYENNNGHVLALEATLRLFALPYATHEDYSWKWKP